MMTSYAYPASTAPGTYPPLGRRLRDPTRRFASMYGNSSRCRYGQL